MPSQGTENSAVSRLRRALAAIQASPAERDRAIKQCLSELRSLADLQGAVTMVEWGASATDEETTTIDRANYALVLARFTNAVRQILHYGQPANVAGTTEMLGRMAALAHATGEPLTLVRGFAPDLADVVIKGPPGLRGLAARTLAQIEPPASIAVPVLSELLRADDASLRRVAADGFVLLLQNALRATGTSGPVLHPAPRHVLVLAASTVLPAVHMGLDDVQPEVRRRCLESIGLACAALTRLMEEHPQSDESSPRPPLGAEYDELRPLLQALRDQGPMLERFLHDVDPQTRILTHKALEELGVARELWLQRCAARREGADEKLLRELLREAVPGLAEELVHPDVHVRRSALDVLEMSGSLALPALPALTRALHDPDRFVRWSAVRTVGKLGPAAAPQTLADLNELLHDPDEELQKAAANALQRLQSPAR
jgi:HEAT repeat protein